MNMKYVMIAVGILVVLGLVLLFQGNAFAKTGAATADVTTPTTGCGSCCSGDCGSCCNGGTCSKTGTTSTTGGCGCK